MDPESRNFLKIPLYPYQSFVQKSNYLCCTYKIKLKFLRLVFQSLDDSAYFLSHDLFKWACFLLSSMWSSSVHSKSLLPLFMPLSLLFPFLNLTQPFSCGSSLIFPERILHYSGPQGLLCPVLPLSLSYHYLHRSGHLAPRVYSLKQSSNLIMSFFSSSTRKLVMDEACAFSFLLFPQFLMH